LTGTPPKLMLEQSGGETVKRTVFGILYLIIVAGVGSAQPMTNADLWDSLTDAQKIFAVYAVVTERHELSAFVSHQLPKEVGGASSESLNHFGILLNHICPPASDELMVYLIQEANILYQLDSYQTVPLSRVVEFAIGENLKTIEPSNGG